MLGPILLVITGILFLLNNLYPTVFRRKMWPVILIVIGLAKVIEYFQAQSQHTRHRKEGE